MTADEIIDGILEREGEGVPPYLDPHDAGGRTRFGISERAHPLLWCNGPPTKEQARTLYLFKYVAPFDALIHAGVDERIRVALIDDGVLSGVSSAIKRIQHVLQVPVDGVLGPITVRALSEASPSAVLQAYVVERAMRLARIVETNHSQARFIVGWLRRALSFLPEPT